MSEYPNQNQQEFLSTTYGHHDLASFNAHDYFSNYHHWEIFDETKVYSSKPFDHDYGYGEHKYVYRLYIIRLHKYDEKIEKKYIVVEEILNDEELKKLERYCQCEICTASIFNITKYFNCRCCVGCLKAGNGFLRQKIIDATRNAYQKDFRDYSYIC
jgi:hypothetical protein